MSQARYFSVDRITRDQAEDSVRITETIRYGWVVESPSASRVDVRDVYGNLTSFYKQGDDLVMLTGGSTGTLLSGVASVNVRVATQPRYRDDGTTSSYPLVAVNEAPITRPFRWRVTGRRRETGISCISRARLAATQHRKPRRGARRPPVSGLAALPRSRQAGAKRDRARISRRPVRARESRHPKPARSASAPKEEV